MIGEGTYVNPGEQGSWFNALIQAMNAAVIKTELMFSRH